VTEIVAAAVWSFVRVHLLALDHVFGRKSRRHGRDASVLMSGESSADG